MIADDKNISTMYNHFGEKQQIHQLPTINSISILNIAIENAPTIYQPLQDLIRYTKNFLLYTYLTLNVIFTNNVFLSVLIFIFTPRTIPSAEHASAAQPPPI